MNIEDIAESIRHQRVRITSHARIEAMADSLSFDEIVHTVSTGEIIEDYPDDWPHPSCLIYGKLPNGEPVHSVWAYERSTSVAVLVTTYRPDPERWHDSRTRRR